MTKIFNTIKLNLKRITLAKLLSISLTILIVSLIKYYLSGNFSFTYEDLLPNIIIGYLAWFFNFSLMLWFSEFLGIKGINFNIAEIFFGVKEPLDQGCTSISNTLNADASNDSLGDNNTSGNDNYVEEGGVGGDVGVGVGGPSNSNMELDENNNESNTNAEEESSDESSHGSDGSADGGYNSDLSETANPGNMTPVPNTPHNEEERSQMLDQIRLYKCDMEAAFERDQQKKILDALTKDEQDLTEKDKKALKFLSKNTNMNNLTKEEIIDSTISEYTHGRKLGDLAESNIAKANAKLIKGGFDPASPEEEWNSDDLFRGLTSSPEGNSPEANNSQGNSPEANNPEENSPEENIPEENISEENMSSGNLGSNLSQPETGESSSSNKGKGKRVCDNMDSDTNSDSEVKKGKRISKDD